MEFLPKKLFVIYLLVKTVTIPGTLKITQFCRDSLSLTELTFGLAFLLLRPPL